MQWKEEVWVVRDCTSAWNAGGEGAAMTELKIWTEVQRFEASDGLAQQTQVAATVIRILCSTVKVKRISFAFSFHFLSTRSQITISSQNTQHSFQSNEELQLEAGNLSRAMCQTVFFVPNLV